MLNYVQILILAVIQGACELLPVSSSAHVIAAEKLMHLDPSSPEMTMLLVMLHTGTMFAVIVYFWKAWWKDYLSSPGQLQWFVIQIFIATVCTVIVGYGLKVVIEKVFMRAVPHAEVEDLFNNLPLIAGALTAVGILIIYAGMRDSKTPRETEIQPAHSVWVGLVQGLCLPFRGFSRSGSTISTGLILGLPKQKLEEFSFALAVVLTPAIVGKEALRLLHQNPAAAQGAQSGHQAMLQLFLPGLIGMVFSFLAGLLALKWLSRWLEGGRWIYFGVYCLIAAVAVLVIHAKVD
ncbi:MAG TPA: undecaprenyl-diphosphate phosphatase [Candidatus Acidoferrales bacterium]|jgi:undecaprenyl-diphosphatase|nr:undecaprenyl-diphosphate phosphatase [Candidatus Acidoferrales bacterium]